MYPGLHMNIRYKNDIVPLYSSQEQSVFLSQYTCNKLYYIPNTIFSSSVRSPLDHIIHMIFFFFVDKIVMF